MEKKNTLDIPLVLTDYQLYYRKHLFKTMNIFINYFKESTKTNKGYTFNCFVTNLKEPNKQFTLINDVEFVLNKFKKTIINIKILTNSSSIS